MLTLFTDGAERFGHFITGPCLVTLERLAESLEVGHAGVRISDNPQLAGWLEECGLVELVSRVLGPQTRAVRAILFDKSPANNWSLGWHQDRTIAVSARAKVVGYGPWTRKAGVDHVEPPFDLFETMLTARIHLDPVSLSNAPLLIAPGSHRSGKVLEADIDAVVAECGSYACLADAGDVWLYRTSILHASAASSDCRRRRVLQIDFAGGDLPPPLHWRGID